MKEIIARMIVEQGKKWKKLSYLYEIYLVFV